MVRDASHHAHGRMFHMRGARHTILAILCT